MMPDHLPGVALSHLLGGCRSIRPSYAQRRFRVLTNIEELERALDYPWDKWAVFLHPAQRRLVERDYNGPARISGSAGTGKTIVALHGAVALARRHLQARVLLTAFSKALANACGYGCGP
jgi:superfamily I DNA and RNA helicase